MGALLLTSLLPTLVAPLIQQAQPHAALTYADWLRTQLGGPADEAFEASVTEALEADPTSLRDFLRVFLDAYTAAHPGADPTSLFAAPAASPTALIAYLEGRFQRLIGDAWLPRPILLTARSFVPATSAERLLAAVVKADVKQTPPSVFTQRSSVVLGAVLRTSLRHALSPRAP